ncbi:MAG: DnaD domain protein [Oscillospiraceae bacterium]|nr:DnaD domain protein [Oscillospiraceae bacterium]
MAQPHYTVNFSAWDGVFAVPDCVVDQHIKLAGAVQLKVLLWVLRHGGKPFSSQDAAEGLHLPEGDVTDAIQYWVAAGLISSPGEENAPDTPEPTAFFTEEKEAPAVKTPLPQKVRRSPKPTGLVLAERISQSEEISFLMQEAQRILGRTISPALSSTLLAAHDDYGLPVEVLIMLLMYVKSVGKISTQYIDAVARGWAEEEIFTHDAAEKKLHQLSEVAKAWRHIENVIGIDHRSPSSREEQYTERWIFQWKFSDEMVREAYERCVDATGKMTLGYMNKILERWHKSGITTIQQAKAEQEERNAKRAPKPEQGRTYDIDAFNDMDFTNEIHFPK